MRSLTNLTKTLNRSTNSTVKFFIILLPIIVVFIAFLFYYRSPLKILPRNDQEVKDSEFTFSVFDDRVENGNSEVKLISADNSIKYSYTLKDSLRYPFAGIVFHKDNDLSDISDYDIIAVKIKASKGTRLPIVFNTYIDNFTEIGQFNSFKNNQYILNVESGLTEVKFKKSDLKTPDWWYTLNKSSESQFGPADYKKLSSIVINNCMMIGRNTEDIVEIQEVNLSLDYFPFFVYSILLCSIYFFAIFLIFRFKSKIAPVAEVSFVYEKRHSVNHLDREEEIVFQYLTSNYYNPELSIVEVQNETGISEQKISAMVKNKTQGNFKQFLNKLRITEAKRLLRETDLQISEIAFKVGYGNISHFNRVFKESEGCSPNDYRKQESKFVI